MDIFQEAARKAAELGGSLDVPKLSWKYAWIQSLFGWRVAKRAQLVLPRIRSSVERYWDKVLFNMAAGSHSR